MRWALAGLLSGQLHLLTVLTAQRDGRRHPRAELHLPGTPGPTPRSEGRGREEPRLLWEAHHPACLPLCPPILSQRGDHQVQGCYQSVNSF